MRWSKAMCCIHGAILREDEVSPLQRRGVTLIRASWIRIALPSALLKPAREVLQRLDKAPYIVAESCETPLPVPGRVLLRICWGAMNRSVAHRNAPCSSHQTLQLELVRSDLLQSFSRRRGKCVDRDLIPPCRIQGCALHDISRRNFA